MGCYFLFSKQFGVIKQFITISLNPYFYENTAANFPFKKIFSLN